MIAATKDELKTPADKQYGYRFGCDGLIGFDEARELLGGVCRKTLYRRIEEGLIRKGNIKKKSVICRRSLVEYISSLES